MNEEKIVKSIAKEAKKNSPTFVIASFIVMATAIFLVITIALPIYNDSWKVGEAIGNTMGNAVGTAIGSVQGVAAIPQAIEDGREEGLSANDTTAEIGEGFSEIGKLEVLISKVKVEHNIDEKTYAAIYVRHGEAIFTVDLALAEIYYNSNSDSFRINIPKPEVQFAIDSTKTEKIAEWEATFSTKSTEDGYIAALNSITKSDEKIKDAIRNYSSLEETASRAAKEQVKMLAESITNKTVDVYFKDGR